MGVCISIIVPVYNVEAYVEECLSSIQAQTLADWECICVDDGSSDESPSVVEKFAAMDARFRLIRQKNGGPGAARNTGMDVARGEYFTFVDADDLIHPEMLEKLLGLARTHDADLVVSDFFRFKSDQEYAERLQGAECRTEEAIVHDAPLLSLLPDWRKLRPESFAKLYLRAHHGQLRFPRLFVAEDLYASYDVYAHLNRAVFTSTPLYGYRQTDSGLTLSLSKFRNGIEGLPEAMVHCEDVLRRNGVSTAVRATVVSSWVRQIFFLVNSMSVNSSFPRHERRNLLFLAASGLRKIRRCIAGQYRIVPLVHFVPYCALCIGSLRLLILWQWIRWIKQYVSSYFKAKQTGIIEEVGNNG